MLFILKLGIKNIFRSKRRTLLTMFAIGVVVFALVVMQGYMLGMLGSMIQNEIEITSGHIKILHPKYLKKEKLMPLHLSVKNLSQVIDSIMQNENVTSVAPRIRFGAPLENEQRTSDCLGIAINPELDQGTAKMTSNIIEGSYWEKGRKGENQGIILGVKTAEELGVKVGDEVSVLARTADFSPYLLVYNVRAIYKTKIAFLDKGMFYIHINDAAGLLNMYDAASEILVMIKDRDMAKQVAGEIKDTFAGKGLEQDLSALSWLEQGGLEDMLENMNGILSIYLLIFTLVAGLTILNTMLMSVFERTNEIGMMRALGMKRLKIIFMIITESVSIAFLASITGGGIGAAFSYFFMEKIGIDISGSMETFSDWLIDPIIRGTFEWTHLGLGLLFGILLAGIAALYPAIRAARMRPVEALRTL